MKIIFHGAVRTVTGSLHVVETAKGDTLLLDCGLFHGRRDEAWERNNDFPVAPRKIHAVIVSHAHIDHIGNLPTWAAAGLHAPIYATNATADLAGLMLRDSAQIQESDARHLNKTRKRGERRVSPLYTRDDAEAAIRLFQGVRYRKWFDVAPGVRAIFHDAGHILGSASITLEERHNGSVKRLVFTGDVGRFAARILKDPEPFEPDADLLISECTYGDKEHPPWPQLGERHHAAIERTVKRGGKVLIPAFALGRTQTIMYAMRQLQRQKRFPNIPIYVDSPMANQATAIVERHPECYDLDANGIFHEEGSLFKLDRFQEVSAREDSKALNARKEPCVIVATSGMCESGRILHHFLHNLEDPRTTVLIVGFQAQHTLGRKLVEGQSDVRVLGRRLAVRAEVEVLNGFSAHADRKELAYHLERSAPVGPLCLVHGDLERAEAFRQYLGARGPAFKDIRIPEAGTALEL